MSLDGLMTHRGSTASVYRPTSAKTASGFGKFTWPVTPASSGVAGLFEPMTAEMADRVFGPERRARWRGFLPLGTDVQEHDGVKLTAGKYSGKKFQVVGPVIHDTARRSDHLEVALIETTEAF